MKRGQFTLFAILGVIIIIIVGLILVYNSTLLSDSRTELSEELVLSQEAIEYYNIVSECIQYSGDISLLNLAAQGGFYTVQEPYHDTGFSKIPYFFYEGQETNYIGKDVFIAEFIESFEFEILSCLNEYESYGDILVVDERSIEYEVDLEDDNIFVDLKIPTEITVSNRTESFQEYKLEIETRIYQMIQLKDEVISYHQENSNELPLSKLIEMFSEDEIDLDINVDENKVLYILTEPNSSIHNGDFNYYFMIKYDWVEEE